MWVRSKRLTASRSNVQRRHYRSPALFALAALALGATHLCYEHLGGGVQSHHLLNRPDLPAVSNWLGLFILPLLGWVFGLRVRDYSTGSSPSGAASGPWVGLAGAFLYGAALAASFELDASALTSGLFLGLFALAAALPVYRAEYILGFVVGMTFTFGAVLPALVAGVVALVSVVVRFVLRAAAAIVRPPS